MMVFRVNIPTYEELDIIQVSWRLPMDFLKSHKAGYK